MTKADVINFLEARQKRAVGKIEEAIYSLAVDEAMARHPDLLPASAAWRLRKRAACNTAC